ncbi:MAG: hypothetical protein L0H93_14795 [Nocardioides sp.]|nr:hypothetical protein [Nocardioides sp.]
MKMQLVNSGLATTSDGHVDYTGDEPAISMSMRAPAIGDQAIETRLLDATMYLAFPSRKGTSSTWYKVDLDDPDNPPADILGGWRHSTHARRSSPSARP